VSLSILSEAAQRHTARINNGNDDNNDGDDNDITTVEARKSDMTGKWRPALFVLPAEPREGRIFPPKRWAGGGRWLAEAEPCGVIKPTHRSFLPFRPCLPAFVFVI